MSSGTPGEPATMGCSGGRGQQLDQRQNEREGFPGSGLRGGNQVAAGEGRLDSQGLHGRGFGKAVLLEVALQESGQREFSETFHLRLYVCEKRNQRADCR